MDKFEEAGGPDAINLITQLAVDIKEGNVESTG
jgi:hypothetical protein